MQLKPDGQRQRAWGLADAEGYVTLAEVCESAEAARALLRVLRIRQPHRRDMRVVELTITTRQTSIDNSRGTL